MSAIEIRITSTDYTRQNFCWFEIFGSTVDWGADDDDWVDNAEWSDVAFATRVIHAQLVAGTTYYHKVRAVYDDGTTVTALGGLITTVAPNDAIPGAVVYKGTWNAATNTPAIPAAAAGNQGWYYRVATAGSTNIDGIDEWKVGDWIISDGTAWQKVDNTDQVTSVAGRQGAVTIAMADITDASANGRSLVQAANYAAMKGLLAIAAGDVSGLGALAILNAVTASLISDASANGRSLITAANYAAMLTLLGYSTGTWTPTFSGLTTTGTVNASGRWIKIFGFMYYSIEITPSGGGTSASAGGGGTLCNNLPFTAADNGLGAVTNGGIVTVGSALVSGTNLFLPAWAASGLNFYISGHCAV